jgi:hypothetical protein
MTTFATNNARFDHLIRLARDLEANAHRYGAFKKQKALQLAAVYLEMAFQAMPSAAAIAELTLTERARLATKLRHMTVQNGCSPAEAENAAQLLLKLEEPA